MTAALFTYEEVDLILRGDGCGDYVGISAIDGLIAAVVLGNESRHRRKFLSIHSTIRQGCADYSASAAR